MPSLTTIDQIGRFLADHNLATLRAALGTDTLTLQQLANEELVVLGAADEGSRLVKCLQQLGNQRITLTDMNPDKVNRLIDCGLTVAPFGAETVANKHVLLATHRTLNAGRAAIAAGARAVTPFLHLQNLYPQVFPPHCFHQGMLEDLLDNFSHIRQLATQLADDFSRLVLTRCLQYRLLGTPESFTDIVDWELYLPRQLSLQDYAACYVDCGAFDGDSVRLHLQRYADAVNSVYAFEPDPATFQALCNKSAHEQRIHCINKGVSDQPGQLQFQSNKERASGFTDDGDIVVGITSLDAELADVKPSLLKMNIEAFEPQAINGATRLIQQFQPALAISVYHRPEHLYSIQQQIRAISDDRYQFYLRQHDGGLVETVLYAIPKTR